MVALIALGARQSSGSDLSRNISNTAHQAVSSITLSCSTDEYCRELTVFIIPACEKLRGAPGCWCGNREAFYRCSLCVSGSIGNQTTHPFQALGELCLVYEQLLQNSTATLRVGLPTPTASANATMGGSSVQDNLEGSRLPVGLIVVGVLSAMFGLLIVFIGVRFLARFIEKNKTKRSSRNAYYYKSIRYSDERSMNVHRSQTAYDSSYECITPRSVSGVPQPEPTSVIGSVDSPQPDSPPPYQASTHLPHRYLSDRKSRAG